MLQSSSNLRAARAGFTLVELLVTIAIIGILAGLLLPNLAAVQATAKASSQSAIIQSFGKGFVDFSAIDPRGRLCSGAYDHGRDGNITTVGWVADLVNAKFANVGKSRDPVNRFQVNTPFSWAVGALSGSSSFNEFVWRSNVSYRPSDGAAVTAASEIKGESFFGTGQTLWESGYHHNFTTTWQFVRGDNNITALDPYTTDADSTDPALCPLDGDGPISVTILGDATLRTSADKIPLLGPAKISYSGDVAVTAAATHAAETINRFIDPTGRKKVAKVGDQVLASICGGPIAEVLGTQGPYEAGSKVYALDDVSPNCKAKKIIHSEAPQGLTAGGYANILFADASCRRVYDNNGYGGAQKGDSWVGPHQSNGNPGFLPPEFVLTTGAFDEVRDEIFLGRLRTRLSAGGGSVE